MKIQIISLFPEVLKPYLSASMIWKATDKKLVKIEYIDLREFGLGKRRTVDDTPYGGGDGMLLKIEPLVAAIELAKSNAPDSLVILPTPRGKLYKQADASELAETGKDLIILCPRYEGYDERITEWVDRQYCIGQFVLTGGEIPALAIVDSVIRLIPGVLGGEKSAQIESFSQGTDIEYPQYTRPEVYKDLKVPDVLLSGHHAEIEKWRKLQSSKPGDLS